MKTPWFATLAAVPLAATSIQEFTLPSQGHTWTYHAVAPPAQGMLPVVLIFHGAGGNGRLTLARNGWARKATLEGFLAVAPTGLPARPAAPPNFGTNPHLWNAGNLRETTPRTRIDDVAFVRDLLADVARRWSIDTRRIYATGHSNGAGLTFLLGARMPERFAAIAPVASLCWIRNPQPAEPVPTLYIVGTADPLVPMDGGESRTPWGHRTSPPVRENLALWSKALGCGDPRIVSAAPGLVQTEYCQGARRFSAIFVEGHGHGWPGGRESGLLASRTGPARNTLNATDTIWDFFRPLRRQ